jgi:hypothetical protein
LEPNKTFENIVEGVTEIYNKCWPNKTINDAVRLIEIQNIQEVIGDFRQEQSKLIGRLISFWDKAYKSG